VCLRSAVLRKPARVQRPDAISIRLRIILNCTKEMAMRLQDNWKTGRRSVATVLLLGLGLAACSSFTLDNVWRAPDFSGPPARKVLVVGVSQSESNRRIFEDGFAQALQASGVVPVTSYGPMPEPGKVSNERLKAAVAQSGVDAVVLTRLVRVDKQVSVMQPAVPMGYRGGYYGWYGAAWAAGPAMVDTYNVVSFETTLWDVKREAVIWSGVTEAIESTNVAKSTAAMAKVLIDRMKKDGVI